MKPLRILYVAYPLLPVSEDSAGGAEQMLWCIERELNSLGHQTFVAAAHGSEVTGRLLDTGAAPQGNDQYQDREQEHTARVLQFCRTHEFDVIHDHSGSFWRHAGQLDTPVLATLHLARRLYPAHAFHKVPGNVTFNFVSRAQSQAFCEIGAWPVIANAIPIERFPFSPEKSDYVLWLGRVCEEKGTDVAIRVAFTARAKLVIAGQVYPFSYHQRYFNREVRPFLNGVIRFVDTPYLAQKLALLRYARAVLIPSQIDETSSLVAMEAAACGTPVLALERGALSEVVREGLTGFVVKDEDEMSSALADIGLIRPEDCRAHAEREFSATRMVKQYKSLYETVLSNSGIADDACKIAAD
jgi:glycosyltransferase involved in cell wall biosynthesis